MARASMKCIAVHACGCALELSCSAHAQCEPAWLPHPASQYIGVRSHCVWNGDLMALGGSVNPPVGGIVRWNGVGWGLEASGVPGAMAMARYGDDLVVGGYFSSAGGVPVNNIARWDGRTWHALGTGIPSPGGSEGVYALAEYVGDLYAGGSFLVAGGQPASCIARWDGASWSQVGSGANSRVLTFAQFEANLIAAGWFWEIGGQFTAIGRWDGTDWHGMNTWGGVSIAVDALAVHDSSLCAARQVEGFPSVLRWTGSQWVQVGSAASIVFALASYRGELIAAGAGAAGPAVHRWNGQSWLPLGAGLAGGSHVYAMAVHDHVLHVGGNFQTAGGLSSPYWARWGCACWPDCNNSGSLTIADFGCFQSQFVQQHPYANCNEDSALTIADFACFQSRFVGGCP